MNTGKMAFPLRRFGSWLVGTALVAGLLADSWAQAPDAQYEAPPILAAADLAPIRLLAGPHHRVDEQVRTDGFLASFSIRSEFGDLEAVGPGMLEVRIHEIEALAVLQDLAEKEQLKQGMKRSAQDKVDGLRHFIDDPKETLEGIPEGVGRFFKRTVRSAKTGVQKVQDLREGRAPGAPVETGPGSRLPGGVDMSADSLPPFRTRLAVVV